MKHSVFNVPDQFYDEIDNFIDHFINERDLIKADKYLFKNDYDETKDERFLGVYFISNGELINAGGTYNSEEIGLSDDPDLSDYDYTYSFTHSCVQRILSIIERKHRNDDIWYFDYAFRVKDGKYYICVTYNEEPVLEYLICVC